MRALDVNWDELSPILVVEVVSEGDPHKDYIRNRRLDWLVPSIEEYWIVDPRDDAARPTMRVHRRAAGAKDWQEIDVPAGGTYETAMLPGFTLRLAARGEPESTK